MSAISNQSSIINEDNARQPAVVDISLEHSSDGTAVVMLDPRDIGQTQLPNREQSTYDHDAFFELQQSIRQAGCNVEPIKIRRRTTTGDSKDVNAAVAYEVIFGHRRLEACRRLGLKVKAIVVQSMSDRQLLVERMAENSGRAEFAPIELGRICRAALDSGMFSQQKQLAIELGRDEGQISKAVALARLPDEILAAFADVAELQYRHVKPLRDALNADEAHVMAMAREIRSGGATQSLDRVLKRLTTPQHEPIEPFNPDTASRSLTCRGKPIGELRVDSNGRVNVLITTKLNADAIDALQQQIETHFAAPRPSPRDQRPTAKAVTAKA